MTRDEFLCKQIGIRWSIYTTDQYSFSTWEGFGKLFTWAKEQEWWNDFQYWYAIDSKEWIGDKLINRREYIIHPDRFADTVARYLGWEGK